MPLIPTQLLSSAFDFVLFFFLVWYDNKRKKNDGEPTGLYLALYSLGRFIVEFWRGDLARGEVGMLSTSQFIAVFVFIVGVIIFVRRRRMQPEAEEQNTEAEEAQPVTEAAAELKPGTETAEAQPDTEMSAEAQTDKETVTAEPQSDTTDTPAAE